ncbi:mitotic regulator LTE1 [Aspergillus lucknowensis]|uniref:Guanine nucleotide exchange factor n=1 Tax=Aspergillus lucknowensis TaxID=176173 RepID=A0ABR4LGF6_9EURO
MGPSAAGFDHPPRKSEEVHLSHSSTVSRSKPDTPTKVPFVTSLRRAHTVAQGRNIARKTNIGSRATVEKPTLPLLRTKDSHELLRRRSFKHLGLQKLSRETSTRARESSHFTVGNVGQNGKIFLRPVRNASLKRSRRTEASPPTSELKLDFLQSQGQGAWYGKNNLSRWSNSQLSELRFEGKEDNEDTASVASDLSRSPSHRQLRQRTLQRSYSFSTISEQRSVSRAEEGKEFRVVIDRPYDRPKSTDGSSLQQLEVPISDYHLGIARSHTTNSNLQGSTQSREAWNPSTTPNTYLHDPAGPSFAPSIFSGVSVMDLTRSAAVSPDPVVYDPGDSIEPSIFEKLVTVMDDESVVRYVPGTKDISAATPARIVAQISSESFMDYDLVSDFFLTFRPYLTTGSLLSLLLARLQWAINRLQEDGRIIRIRTFAALRHWILNYFVDDFVPDFKLRAHFCETINRLYDSVKARQDGGMSDLKILIDLKRCWHGKCSAYWDIPEHYIPYNSPDLPIGPGGDEPTVGGDLQNVAPTHSTQMPGVMAAGNTSLPVHHERNDSSATAKSMPVSAGSDWSAPAISCSLPPKSPKRHSIPFSPTKVPRPVPVIPKQLGSSQGPSSPLSPIGSRRLPCYGHAHKRSGSFSDSFRDERAPISLPHFDTKSSFSSHEPCYLGNLIRGELYPPVESYMTMMAPPSPPLPSLPTGVRIDRRSTVERPSQPAPSASGVKTIIGSIRRALHSKQPAPHVSPRPVNGPSTRGKTSALPTNVAFGSNLYRDKKLVPPVKKPTRFDLLCEEALRQYRLASGEYPDSGAESKGSQQHTGQIPVLRPQSHLVPHDAGAQRHLTGGSESIVIVDDTGIGAPVMTGGVGMQPVSLDQPPMFLTSGSSPATPRARTFFSSSRGSTLGDEYSLPIFYDETSQSRRVSTFHGPSGEPAPRRSFSLERRSSFWKPSRSVRLRKYASFQSGFSRSDAAMENESGASVADSSILNLADKQAGPTLRRRPGGDLRRMRHGVGAQAYPDSASIWSDVTYKSSMAASTANTIENATSRPQTSLVPPKPRFSLLKTHSSQLIRRSFESALARFAQIPDDEDGGIESTLLKLEGKWKGQPTDEQGAAIVGPSKARERFHGLGSAREAPIDHRDYYPRSSTPSNSHQNLGENLTYSQVQARILTTGPYSESVVGSEDSYNSIPLLERGLSDESMKKLVADQHPGYTPAPSQNATYANSSDLESSHASIDMVKKTESIKRIPRGSTLPVPNATSSKSRPSRLSGLSSEVSADLIDVNEAAEARLSFDTRSLGESSLEIPPHPLAHPPSPPMTVQNHRSLHSYHASLNPNMAGAQPLTPDPSPVTKAIKRTNIRSLDMQHVSGDILRRSESDHPPPGLATAPESRHVPFILACESHILAQQFTLVEMAALSEVDWRDLVDMGWNGGPPFTTSWVQFLVDEERRGIDLVVGRFNIMVKWVLSEIVLTLDIHDRARTIAKFIHTAAHARRICNYATMLQIAIALTSTDCSRLQSTWDLVSTEDRRVLKDMEFLIQPVRNFHDLRVEMETANVQEGSIPFVGLYIHDLTYNAQKPAQVAATREGEPLVNFERYRTTARIVKSLLRLIDASTKYKIEPVPGVIERALWIASLSEEQIQIRSKLLV